MVTTVGGVVLPRMTLVEIVPIEDTLLVEARIRPSDVAFLEPGQPAEDHTSGERQPPQPRQGTTTT